MDCIVVEKKSISSFRELYGCEVEETPVSREDRIAMHEDQLKKALRVHEKLNDRSSDIRRRIVKVNDAINWNRLMLEDLNKGK